MYKSMVLAKTLKIVLPSRRNANFQEFKVPKKEKNQANIDEKSYVLGGIDFGWILEGFWEAKILDFRNFFVIFSMQKLKCKKFGQKMKKARNLEAGPLPARRPTP